MYSVTKVPRGSFTEDIVYSFVCRHPGLCTYDISKKLNMSGGRVRYALSKLKKMGLIEFEFERTNPRIRKLTYPVDAWLLLPENLRARLRKLRI